MFIISGTPFVTTITFDFIMITKSMASNDVRKRWGKECTDASLKQLFDGWVPAPLTDKLPPTLQAAQEAQQKAAAEVLSKYTLRRDHKSRIDREFVLIDHIGQCKLMDAPLQPIPGEVDERRKVYGQWIGDTRVTKDYNQRIRCLSYSDQFVEWSQQSQGTRASAAVWNSYSLDETSKHTRTSTLITILKEGKKTGNGVVIFVDRVCLLELAVKVSF